MDRSLEEKRFRNDPRPLVLGGGWVCVVGLGVWAGTGRVDPERLWVLGPMLGLLALAHAGFRLTGRGGNAAAVAPRPSGEDDPEEPDGTSGAGPSRLELNSARIRLQRMEMLLTDCQQAEADAKRQTSRLWEVFYQLNHPAGFLDVEGRILDVNAAAIDLMRRPVRDLRGHLLTEVKIFGGPDVFEDPLARAREGETVQFQQEVVTGSGPPHILIMSLKPVLNQGQVELLILEGHDITERIRAEEALQETFNQFQQSQKMEAIGRLAGGIAHDFNNLLTSILGFGNMALEEVGEEASVTEDLQEVVQAATRAQSLTQKLLALSRKDVPDSRPVDLNRLIRGMDNIFRVTLPENLEWVFDLDETPCVVQADPTSLEQVILNLAVNARDAMPRSGRLYMSTATTRVEERMAYEEGLEAGDYVVFTIRDTGSGMEPEVMEHAFEPFYTTKESGQGTGLGLSTVYAIIKQYLGAIRLESEPGEGTEIRIFLPRVHLDEQMELDLPRQSSLSQLPSGKETVLLVEDEEGVRRMASRIITSLGYTLLTAGDGEEGVRVAEAHEGTVDLIVTDVVMPNLSGPEMIDRLRVSLGHIPHLYVSGFTMDKLKEHGADDSDQILIRKPYDRETLARRIRTALDQNPKRG